MDLCSGDKQKVQCPRLPQTSAQQTAVKEYSQVEKYFIACLGQYPWYFPMGCWDGHMTITKNGQRQKL